MMEKEEKDIIMNLKVSYKFDNDVYNNMEKLKVEICNQ